MQYVYRYPLGLATKGELEGIDTSLWRWKLKKTGKVRDAALKSYGKRNSLIEESLIVPSGEPQVEDASTSTRNGALKASPLECNQRGCR